MNTFAIGRANAASADERNHLEIGLAAPASREPERGYVAAILAEPADAALRLVFSDWLEGAGRHEDARRVRLLAARPWRDYHRPELAPGQWSVVRRVTLGANGGHKNHFVGWERVSVEIVRLTRTQAVLADGRRFALATLSAPVAAVEG